MKKKSCGLSLATSILLADEAVAIKAVVAGKGAFGKDGGKGKGDVAMNF